MRLRKLAGFAAGAVVLGGMSVPAFMAPAQAAVTSTANPTFTCGSGQQQSTYAPTITFRLGHNNGGATLSAKLTDMPNGAPAQFVNFPDATIANKLTVEIGGVNVDLVGSHTADFIGQVPTKMPEAKATLATRPSTVAIKSYSYDVNKADGSDAAAQSCVLSSTVPAPAPVTFADEPQMEGINAVCAIDLTESGFGGLTNFPAKVETTATVPASGKVGVGASVPVTTTITLAREFSDYLETSPVKKVTGSVTPKVAVGAATATGNVALSVWNRTLTPGNPIGQPINEYVALTGTGTATVTPTAAGSHTATLTGHKGSAAMTVTFGDVTMQAPMDCTLTTAATVGTISVAAAGPSAACVAAKAAAVKADAAVKAAQVKATKAGAKVKKLKAAVKKAKGAAKKKKAKAKLKKGKAAAKSANAALASAKTKAAAAKTAQTKAC